jgi:PEGA domain
MSAPPPDLLAPGASTSSSGFADGMGRRTLAFDREEGTMLERLVVRPELAAFEKMLRERVDRVAALEDERIARPRTVERDCDGALVVVSEFVPGSRLSDLLETSAELGNAPGVDAAFGYLLDVLPALVGLHAGAGFAHGTIAPSRTVLTPAGQVVLLDAVYGGALAHLRYGRQTLWTEFGIAAPASAGAPRLDVQADIAQVVLASVMLVLGRPLRVDEFPAGLSNVILEVVDVAQIRGSATFADGVLDFLQRALPLHGSRPYASADDTLFDLRQLVSELGLHVCRRALVDFIEQMEPSAAGAARARNADEESPSLVHHETPEAELETLDHGLEAKPEPEPDLESGVDAEIDLESLVEEPLYDLDNATEIEVSTQQSSLDDPLVLSWTDESELPSQDAPSWDAHEPATLEAVEAPASAPVSADAVALHETSAPAELAALTDPIPVSSIEQEVQEPMALPDPPPAVATTPSVETAASAVESSSRLDAAEDEEEADAPSSVRSRRAKRARSPRSRKDRLRSAAVPAPPITPKPAKVEREPMPEKPPAETWLVPPERAAAFEPAVSDSQVLRQMAPPFAAAPAAPPVQVQAVPPSFVEPPFAAPVTFPAPAAPLPAASRVPEPFARPVLPPVPAPPARSTTAAWPAPPQASPLMHPAIVPQHAPVKLKEPAKKARSARPAAAAPEMFTTVAPPARDGEAAGGFPWKLVAAAVVLLAMGLAGGRSYLGPATKPAAPETTDKPAAPVASAPAANPTTVGTPAPNAGRLEIETQPAGARVLVDGKFAGESPVSIDGVSAGRHTITFVSSLGSVKKTIRIEAGRTAKLDVPIFSGWVGIFAPFVVDVAESGNVIGTTEEPRLMLGPGRHTLTLTNKELGYSSTKEVDIEPGEVRSISLDPRGKVNLNATPWAEVWLDGKKLGDTPIANLDMPLGIREVVFRHPQFGERRVTVTVKGNTAAAVSVDMSKP